MSEWVAVLLVVVLGLASALVLVRIVRGPSILDRVVAIDVLISIVVCALGLEAAINHHSTTLPILLALSLISFVGSVSVARFVAREGEQDTSSDPVLPSTGRVRRPSGGSS